jgi:hypothetical protein
MGNMMADVVLEYGNKVFKREGKIISICILNNGGISHFTQRKAFRNGFEIMPLKTV